MSLMPLLAVLLTLFVYLAAVVASCRYKWRWFSAGFVTLLNFALTALLVLLFTAPADWSDGSGTAPSHLIVYVYLTPVTGYLLMLSIATIVRKTFAIYILAPIAHILLLIDVSMWGLGHLVYVFAGIIIVMSAPIWLLACLVKPPKTPAAVGAGGVVAGQ
jgi:hypothetical protein